MKKQFFKLEIRELEKEPKSMLQLNADASHQFIVTRLADLFSRDKLLKQAFQDALDLSKEYEARALAKIDAQAEKFAADIDQLIQEINQQ